MANEKVVVEFQGQDKLTPVIGKMQTGIKALETTLNSVGAIFITGAIAQGLKYMYDQAGESELATNRLNNELQKITGNSAKYEKAFSDMSIAIQKHTKFTDEQALDSMTRLLQITGDVGTAYRGVSVASELAQARGMDLEQASTLVGRAMMGQEESLKRLGIYLTKGATATQILSEIQKKFAGESEQYAKSALGTWDELLKALGNTAEALGTIVVPILKPIFEFITIVLNTLSGQVLNLVNGFQKLFKGDLKGAGEEFGNMLVNNIFNNTMKWLSGTKEVGYTFDKIVPEIKAGLGEVNTSLDLTAEGTKQLEKYLQSWGSTMMGLFSSVGDAIGQTAMGSSDAWRSATRSMLMSVLDFAQQSLNAMVIVNGVLNPAMLLPAIAGSLAIGTLKGVVSQGTTEGVMKSGGSTNAVQSGVVGGNPSTSSGGAVAPATGSGYGGGSQVNIILQNPVFMDKETQNNAVLNIFKIAQNLGYNVQRNPAVSMA